MCGLPILAMLALTKRLVCYSLERMSMTDFSALPAQIGSG
jgi:iron complex outermembrane receptor protein